VKQIGSKVASGIIKFLTGSCLSELGIVFKELLAILFYGRNRLIKHRLLLIARVNFFITIPYSRVLSAFGVVFQEKFNHT
jgi:hypothetical protein